MNNDLMRIRLSDIVYAVVKRRIMIAILTVAGLIIGILLSIVSYMRGEMVKEYAISSSFAVTSVNEDGMFASRTANPNSTDIYLAQNMVDSVIYVLRSDRTLNAAINKLNLVGISGREIARNLTLKQYNETQIVEMTLYWRSAEEGIQILNAINQVSPEILIETLKIGGLAVVNPPTSRYLVGGSVNASLWIYMAILGFIVGCGLSVLDVLLKPTLINYKDVQSNFDLDILALLPDDRPFFSRKHLAALPLDEAGQTSDVDSVVTEEFGSAAHILRNRLNKTKPQCIYITSTTRNEGRTSIAANLALQLADLEQKVLLIDFDVRNPSLGSLFVDKVDYYHSLNALYHGETTQEDAITHVTGFLDLLPSILERSSLPLDEAMMAMVSKMIPSYDYVLMDTAPVGQTSDTMNLNRIADAAIFVIRYDTATMPEIQEALDRLEKSGTNVIGTFVNGVKRANSTGMIKNPFERKLSTPEYRKSRDNIDTLNEMVSQPKSKDYSAEQSSGISVTSTVEEDYQPLSGSVSDGEEQQEVQHEVETDQEDFMYDESAAENEQTDNLNAEDQQPDSKTNGDVDPYVLLARSIKETENDMDTYGNNSAGK